MQARRPAQPLLLLSASSLVRMAAPFTSNHPLQAQLGGLISCSGWICSGLKGICCVHMAVML